jgi:hypothetical protein
LIVVCCCCKRYDTVSWILTELICFILSDDLVEDARQAGGDRMETGSEMDMSGADEVSVVLERIRSGRAGVYVGVKNVSCETSHFGKAW